MCGITGIYKSQLECSVDKDVLLSMTRALEHRGPDEMNCFVDNNIGFGFQRLSIIDPANGSQPFSNEDNTIHVVCNGEIYNYKELRIDLQKKGNRFKTNCDIEVIIPLYLEYGVEFLKKLNGQFSIALYNKENGVLLLARDHFGICPLFYSCMGTTFLFGSEIKAILRYPGVKRKVDLTGLDQVFSFPGLVSPTTMFEDIKSVKPGHYLLVRDGKLSIHEYWDLDYPEEHSEVSPYPVQYYIDQVEELLLRSVKYRLNADVPVGFYLSGGLDSSLVGAMMKKITPASRYESFSISFPDEENRDIDESAYQQLVSAHIGSGHNQIHYDWRQISAGLNKVIYYSECPLKESYNTCSLSLSAAAREKNIKVILSGEGADEFFGGYVGYRFDIERSQQAQAKTLEDMLEDQERKKLWGDSNFFYEKNYYEFAEIKRTLYSESVNSNYNRFNCYTHLDINKDRLSNRNYMHKRSYLDLKLRLSDHLIADHCDRTCYANSVEGRYPFLDIDLVEFVKTIPPEHKLNGLIEKYILKKIGSKYLPEIIFNREKKGFVAPGSPYLLKNNIDWVEDLLSYDLIKRQGYFNADVVEKLKRIYRSENFRLHLPFDSDLLMIVLTFNMFLQIFDITEH
jgi:asparagine synthase (glutamine-hydrolysing)